MLLVELIPSHFLLLVFVDKLALPLPRSMWDLVCLDPEFLEEYPGKLQTFWPLSLNALLSHPAVLMG